MLMLTQSQLNTKKKVNQYTPVTVYFPSINFKTIVQNVYPLKEAIRRVGSSPERFGLIFSEPSLTEDKYLLLSELEAEALYYVEPTVGWKDM